MLAVIVCFVFLVLAYLVFLADPSLLSIMQKKSQVAQLEKQKKELEVSNKQLAEELKRAENDLSYLESVARERNLVRKNEIIIDFSQPAKEGKK